MRADFILKGWIFVLFYCITGLAQVNNSDLIISEVMFFAPSGNNEFIEIYNKGEAPVSLFGFKIKYYTSNTDSIISAGWGTLLPPKSYAVVFEGDYSFSTGIYNSIIPVGALKLKIDDNSFGTNGMANTTGRSLRLINSANDTIDYYTYSADNSSGYSDEKIILNNDTSSVNWSNSLRYQGSPGYKNSVSPSLQDIMIKSLKLYPSAPFEHSSAELEIKLKNAGMNVSGSFILNIYDDTDLDSIPAPSELLQTINYNPLSPNDSIITNFEYTTAGAGKYNLIAKINYPDDEDSLNNIMMLTFNVLRGTSSKNKIIVNEIMYTPSVGHPEWVELFNRSDEVIDLKKWRISDNSTSAVITLKNKLIYPGKFVVLCRDTSVYNFYNKDIDVIFLSLPQLNNTGDRVVLSDSLYNIIDSLDYLPSWGGSTGGFSLERINIDDGSLNELNWGTCTSKLKGTPGSINSVTPKNNDLALLSLKVPQFAAVGDVIPLECKIKNKGLLISSDYSVKFYYDANKDSTVQPGELFSTLTGEPLSSKDSTDLKGYFTVTNAGINNFIAVIETLTDDDPENNFNYAACISTQINEFRNDLIINEIMYAPESGHPEYIEIYNNSGNKILNFKTHSIADRNDTVKIDNNIVLLPDEFLVIADDSSFYSYYPVKSKLIIGNIPSLNNTGDAVVLLDSLNRVIDSLVYTPNWGGNNGVSLEKISPSVSSIDSLNWGSSLSKLKGTPGYVNSISIKEKDIETAGILFSPVYPIIGDTVTVSVHLKNNGTTDAIANVTLFEDTDLDSVADVEWQSMNDIFVPARDSLIINFNQQIKSISAAKGFYCTADFNGDQDTSNNYIYGVIQPGVIPSSVVINEIMYAPAGGEPEWIELFNKSSMPVLLKDWFISDVITTPSVKTIKDSVFISPNSFLTISSDSAIFDYHLNVPGKILIMTLPSLNNTGDGVVIKDNRKIIIDSVLFNTDWGGQSGQSLERVSIDEFSNPKSNWGSSKDIEGSTPGRANSLKEKNYDAVVTGISIYPRFPVRGDNISLRGIIKNNGKHSLENGSAMFYSKINGIISLLGTKENIFIPIGDSIEITIPEEIENIQDSLLAGLKINFLLDEDTINNTFEKKILPGEKEKSIVINEIMYDPKTNESEWIELYNPDGTSVNIKDWKISDVISPQIGVISTNDLFIEPDKYFVIAKDSSFRSEFPDENIKFTTADFGILGNTGDGVMLFDFRDAIIDSVFYKTSWGHEKGCSIERFSSMASSSDSSNWFLSVSPKGSTPGKSNSAANVIKGEKQSLVINEIMYDPSEGNCEFIELYNNSDKDVNIGGWSIINKDNDIIRIANSSVTINKHSYFVIASDSSFMTKYNYVENNYGIMNKADLGLTTEGIIVLKDFFGSVIDSISYSDKWHNKIQHFRKDKSLERINPSLKSNDPFNWSTSVSISGATPGVRNSIFLDNQNTLTDLSISPNPFSPDNDGFEDVTIINYRFGFPVSSLMIKVFDSKGRLVKSISDLNSSSSEGSIIFNGAGDDNIPLRMGIYILLAEGKNYLTGEIKTLKSTFVVARRLN